MGAIGRKVVIVEAVETQERFVYRIHFGGGRESGEDAHHTARHIAVEGVVGGEYCYIVLLDQLFELVGGFAHRDAQCLGLFGAGHDAAVDAKPLEGEFAIKDYATLIYGNPSVVEVLSTKAVNRFQKSLRSNCVVLRLGCRLIPETYN